MNKSRGPLRAAIIIAVVAVVAAAALAVASCGGTDTAEQNIPEAAAATDTITTWADALDSNGLTDTLNEAGPFVVFASSNDAVSAAGDGALTADVQQAMILPADDEGAVPTEDELKAGFKGGSMLEDNDVITYTGSDGSLYVNSMKVTEGPIEAKNGTIYVVDGVITPK